MTDSCTSPILLIADDSTDDVFLLRRALTKAQFPAGVRVVQDGQEAMDYLRGSGTYADRQAHPLPELLLLDLKMPRLNGLEVLEWLRTESRVSTIPVVILSSSGLPTDVKRSYLLGANAYVVKPKGGDGLEKLVEAIQKFWIEINTPPPIDS